ncbi:FAD-dependent oxidoreductase [Klebsiella grimontii]|uniref:oxidoreductase n=1 Tax=Klebsiella grimontii TaxID=2058152 RepID=UPI001CCE6A37|nr:FAD-dependent oxidoreductase [Klebsiella grimontii]MBZ7515520.1 FAD-dependent oxidoreductase [Klebsiella grimontii]MDD9675802.1 FAD-dependent oxidoreductase [Klebsiella grimontii]MDD9681432.1 FAD-dependent oxidoreductase [Klebsiella grimontii]MDD9692093.1 FAD-dependent oxidoreductase [Klebsiella grimontii]MDD9700970.1 FAD-dependent oxidoreductase [Klebsiella grimontii]
MSHYPHLFSPLTINGMTIKNRIIMPPMGTNLASLNGEVTQEQIDYYELRARGGTGLITIENICIDFPFASNGTTQLRIDNDQYIPRLFKLTETLHKHGACVGIQLNHAGASAYAYRLNGEMPLSSSSTPSKKNGNIPRPMTHDEIYHAVDKFGDAAERVRRAGFDCVEIHAGHSYLISQFLSPLFNKRTDEFGGSVENRARILTLIVDKVRACVGPRFPVSLRISADDFLEGGNTLEDSLRILELCEEKVDIINVSAAQNDNLNFQIDQMSLEDGWKRYLSRAVRDKFHKPTVIAGNIRTPKVAEDIIASGDADLIAIGRGLIAEPEWVQKVQSGNERLMRKCISCNIGCADHRIARSRPLRCSINPDIIHGDAYKQQRVIRDTNVVVIGAGTAGMEAACTAAEVGCHTWLLEEKHSIGGLASEISLLPEKKRIADFPQFMKNRIASLDNLMLQVGKRATVASVSALRPNLIVNATGSVPLLLPIEGLRENIDVEGGNVFSITNMIHHLDQFADATGKRIAVVGAGAVGLDVIEYFSARGASAVLIEMQDAPGRDLDIITKNAMLTMLDEHHVEQHMRTQLVAVTPTHFTVKNTDGAFDIPFDYGFVCLGMRANTAGLNEIEQWARANNVKIMNIGDSLMARRIIDGVREGRNVLDTLEDMGALGNRESTKIPFLTY